MRWLALVMLCACGHSRLPTLYTLSTSDPRARSDVAGVIELRTPRLPGYLDRNQLVLEAADAKLELARDAQWAEPLDAMIARVLADDLGRCLPGVQVTLDSGHTRTDAGLRIDLDVRRLERDRSGELVFDGQLALRPAAGPAVLQAVRLRTPSAREPGAVARAISTLLAKLAEQAADGAAPLLRSR